VRLCNSNAMLGKAVKSRCCPATVSDVLRKRGRHCAKREGTMFNTSQVRRPVALWMYMFLFRGEGDLL
jgi:hypothetical protein